MNNETKQPTVASPIEPVVSAAHEWISIGEKMPNVGQKVLILMAVGGNIEKGEYLGGGNFLGNWFNTRGKDHCYKVTHWMIKPNMPEAH
jgi:hypothetical protein